VGGPLTVGVVGVGTISRQYFDTLPGHPGVELVAVADLDAGRAAEVAGEQGVEALSLDELFADPRIDAVLNLTIPAAHVEIDLRAIGAGKHVYGEKPLALDLEGAARVLAAARDAGVLVGSAPDTVLGTGIQTARALLDDGAIGEPVGAAVHWSSPGHESWHPAPQFYYQPGAGPLYDMGPYYLTSLVTLLGPVERVAGSSLRSARTRVVATGPAAGAEIPVAVDTHVTAILEHAGGVSSTVTMSFDVWQSRAPQFEVFGTSGTLAVPDPNRFSDPVNVWTGSDGWTESAPRAGYVDAGRGVGLADLAGALRTGRPHRASGELAYHVLEIMDAILRSSADKRVVELTSTVQRPAPVELGADPDGR
jgi:predicted dehydrogenase